MPKQKSSKQKPGTTAKDEYTKQKLKEERTKSEEQHAQALEAAGYANTQEAPLPTSNLYRQACEIDDAIRVIDNQNKELEWKEDEPMILSMRSAMADILRSVQEVERDMLAVRDSMDAGMKFGYDGILPRLSGNVPSGPYYQAVNQYLESTLKAYRIFDLKWWLDVRKDDADEYRRRLRMPCAINDFGEQDISELPNVVVFWDFRGVELILQEIAQLHDSIGWDHMKKMEQLADIKKQLSSTQREYISLLQKYPQEHRKCVVLKDLPRVQKLLQCYQKTHDERELQFKRLRSLSLIPYEQLVESKGVNKQQTRIFKDRLCKSTAIGSLIEPEVPGLTWELPNHESAEFQKASKQTARKFRMR